MERKQFLKLCQRTAFQPNSVTGKENIENYTVKYNGGTYYPVEYVLWFDKDGKTQHSAVLHDINAKSTVRVPLEKVEK